MEPGEGAKEKAFNTGYRVMVAVMPARVDEFIKWLMTGTGAIAGLMVAGTDKLLPVLGINGFRVTVYLLLASLGVGMASRLLGSIVMVANEALEQMEERLSVGEDIPLQVSFLAGNEDPGVEEQMREEFAAPLPIHIRLMTRWLTWRRRKNSKLSFVGRLLVRASVWQGLFALISLLVTAAALLWAASSIAPVQS